MADINLAPYTAEQQAMDRRRKLAEALQQQAIAPIEMPTTPGVKISPYAGLAKLLQGYIAGKNLNKADQEQKDYENSVSEDMARLFRNMGKTETMPGDIIKPGQESMFIPENVTRYNETKNQPESFTEEERDAAIDLPLKTKAVLEEREPSRQVPLLSADLLNPTNPLAMKTGQGKQMLAQYLMQQEAQKQAAAQAELAASRQIHKFSPEDTAGTIVNNVFKPIVTGVKKPNWEKFSKFDDKTGVEITGLIDKNAPNPLDTFVEGARKPEDFVSVDTTNAQGQPVTRYFKKSDPLLTSGVPKPLVGILGDLQMAGALPANWKDNPAIVDLVNTSFINKTGGITPKDVFNFKVAVADLNIKKATLADQGIDANVAIPTAPAQSTGVLGAIQNRPVSQLAPVTAPAVVPTAKANRPYTPLNAPQSVTPAPVAEPIAAPAQLSPRDMREIEKQKILSANKDMTETQSNAALFGGSMAQAHATMNQLEKAGTVKNAVIPAMMQSLVGLVPLGVGEKVADQIESIAKTDPTGMFGPDQNQQRLGQAQVAFATSWLRKTSGASFGASEVANTIKEFFPMRGEGDSVIKQKREARDRAIEGMKLGTTKEGQAYIDRYLGVAPKPAGGGNDPLGLRGK